MKYFLYVIALLYPIITFANNNNKDIHSTTISYNITVGDNDSHTGKLTAIPDLIYGISIDGDLSFTQADYLVRVLVKEKNGREHLIMESYREIQGNVPAQFEDYSEETFLTKGIELDSIKVYSRGAILHIKGFRYIQDIQISKQSNNFEELARRKKDKTIITNVERINEYNERHNILWRADKTWLSQQNYETKKNVLGLKDDFCSTRGIEYYAGGIIEIDDSEQIVDPQRTATSYVGNFDWRNRHGKNWMTPVKDQGNSNCCFLFTCVGAVEALANLYYNQKLDLKLSEQELISCSGLSNPYNNGTPSELNELPLNYLVNHGICDSVSYPFVNYPYQPCLSGLITPNEQISISGYCEVSRVENDIKNAIINHGPLVSGIRSPVWMNHSMVLVGYGVLQAGDTIYHHLGYDYNTGTYFHDKFLTVEADDPRIGRTYMVYKSSYGLADNDTNQGYMYVIHNNYNTSLTRTFYLETPITSMNYSSQDVILEDADGDGYYYWGIGSKPSTAPSWVPDEPDGDDSNINYGPMDEYGNMAFFPCVTINRMLSYTGNHTLSGRVEIVNGGILTISGTTTMNGNSQLEVCNEGTLIIDGGTIRHANIVLDSGGSVIIRNGGVVNMASGKTFATPIGALLNVESGEIY